MADDEVFAVSAAQRVAALYNLAAMGVPLPCWTAADTKVLLNAMSNQPVVARACTRWARRHANQG